jgi:hypothetical protein
MNDIDRHLDDLFDRMAGQGAVGRRMLAEAEEHLRTAAADAQARGRSPEEAEREAVAAFGAVAPIANGLRRAHRGTGSARATSGGLLLTGRALSVLSLVHLFAAACLSPWAWGSYGAALCSGVPKVFQPTCGYSPDVAAATTVTGLALGALGLLVLLARRALIRHGRLPAVAGPFTTLGATLLALAAVLVLIDLPWLAGALVDQPVEPVPGRRTAVLATVASLLIATVAVGGQVLSIRRRIQRPAPVAGQPQTER